MKKPQTIQISIPQPCSESWQKMTPQEKGRYCDACQKCVVDFTGFSDRQLYDYFIQHKGKKICGHFKSTQLNRSITLPPQPHSKLYRIAVALGLTVALVTAAEQRSFAKAPLVEYSFVDNYNTDDTTQNNTDSTYATIKGQVVDENGEPLVNAAVELVLGGVVKTGIVTDYDGYYTIRVYNVNPDATYTLRTKYVGKKDFTITGILLQYNTTTKCDVKLESNNTVLDGDVIIIINPPLIDPNNPSAGNKTITSDQIEKTAH